MRRVHPRTDIMPFPGPRYGGVGRVFPEPQASNAGAVEALDAYDAGLLSDYGGGDVDWWWRYIREELSRAHEFYAIQFAALSTPEPQTGDRDDFESAQDFEEMCDAPAIVPDAGHWKALYETERAAREADKSKRVEAERDMEEWCASSQAMHAKALANAEACNVETLRADDAERRFAEVEKLLRNLVAAEDHLVAIRSQPTWVQMGHDQGGIDAMNKLSRARIEASAALRAKPEAQALAPKPKVEERV